MSVRNRWRSQRGQSLIELMFLLPIYVLLMILVVQMTATYFGVFGDLSKVRDDALAAGRKADIVHVACYEQRDRHTFLMGLTGPSQSYETRVRLYAYGSGPANCPD